MNVTMDDLLVGIKVETINDMISQVHKNFSSYFKGEIEYGKYSLVWNIAKSPIVDFSKPAVEAVRSYYIKILNSSNGHSEPYNNDLIEYVNTQGPGFIAKVFGIEMYLHKEDPTPPPKIPTFDVDFSIRVDMEKKLQFEICDKKIVAVHDSDPATTTLFATHALPFLVDYINKLLTGLTIPAIDWEGLHLNPPTIQITEDCFYLNYAVDSHLPLVASALSSSSNSKGLSVKMSERFINELVNASKVFPMNFGDKGKSKATPFFAEWHYSLSLDKGTIGVRNTRIYSKISSKGKAGASAGMELGCLIPPLSAGLALKLGLTNNPEVELEFNFSNGKINAVTKSVSPFSVYCEPDGSPIVWFMSAIASLVLNPIIMSARHFAYLFLNDIKISICKIPSSLTIFDIDINFKLFNLEIINLGNMLCIESDINLIF